MTNDNRSGPGGRPGGERSSRGPGGERGPRAGPGGGRDRDGKGRGGGRDRDGKGRGGGRGRDDRERGGAGSASYRVVSELPALEKALSAGDLARQKEPLGEILKSLRPLHLKSLEELDLNTRGRLITTLARVGRQVKPTPSPEAAAPVAGGAAVTPPAEVSEPAEPAAAAPEAPSEPAVAEGLVPGQAAAGAPSGVSTPAAEAVGAPSFEIPSVPLGEPAVGQAPEAGEPPRQPPAPAPDPKVLAYQEVMYLVGSIWRAVGEESRAAGAFAASGRKADQAEAVKILKKTGDWREEASILETQKRTRDAARLYEKHGAHADAARLYEAGGDLKAALRSAIAAKDLETARRLLKALPLADSQPILEKLGAWELLMEHYVATSDFEAVAKLYERARQFDQAALAWERSGKLANARRAYERARDPQGAARVRDLEIEKLIARGDRLGAAVLLIGAGLRQRAVETLVALPAPKAFRFLQKVELDDEALALAKKEIARAEEASKPGEKARWLEMLGDAQAAAEAWEKAERKDRALAMHEQAGNWQRAAEMAEALLQYDKAVELFHRAGDKANAARVDALPRPALPTPEAPSAEPSAGEGEAPQADPAGP